MLNRDAKRTRRELLTNATWMAGSFLDGGITGWQRSSPLPLRNG